MAHQAVSVLLLLFLFIYFTICLAVPGLIGKDSDAGRDWGQEEKETTENEMAGWHHGLDECESE